MQFGVRNGKFKVFRSAKSDDDLDPVGRNEDYDPTNPLHNQIMLRAAQISLQYSTCASANLLVLLPKNGITLIQEVCIGGDRTIKGFQITIYSTVQGTLTGTDPEIVSSPGRTCMLFVSRHESQ